MVSYKNMKTLWSVRVISEHKLSDKEKDFIADLIDAESHNAIGTHRFILHDILEENNVVEAIIEGKRIAANNIKEVLIANIGRSEIQRR